jgi:DNA-directed RNA polymerase subunit RPC12/RpoP
MAYVDKELIDKLKHACIAKYPLSYIDGILAFVKEIRDMPTADVVEVVHGEWINEELTCSVCGRDISEIYDGDGYMSYDIEEDLLYCPYCGAKMDGGRIHKEQG